MGGLIVASGRLIVVQDCGTRDILRVWVCGEEEDEGEGVRKVAGMRREKRGLSMLGDGYPAD